MKRTRPAERAWTRAGAAVGVGVLAAVFAMGVSVMAQSSSEAAAHATSKSETVPTGFLTKGLTVAGVEHRYVVYVPRDYAPDRDWPCILFLHGRGESGADGLKPVAQGIGSAILWNAAEWPFVVVIPQKPDANRPWIEFEGAVLAMLDQAAKDYRVDADRVYLTGLSQGGHGTWEIGSRHAGRFAAIAPICGFTRFPPAAGVDQQRAAAWARALASTPVWAFHGLADDVVNAEHTRAMMEALQGGEADRNATYYEGVGHNAWDRAYRDHKLASWFLSHRRRGR